MLQEKNIELKKFFRKSFSSQPEIDFWQDVYDRKDFLGECFRARMNIVMSWIENLNIQSDSKVLDVGCGPGLIVKEVAKRGYRAIGVDFSYGMLKKANNTNKADFNLNAMLAQADIESLPFKDSSFDLVVCLGVITYLKTLEKTFNELNRVIKPNGTLMISIVNKARLIDRLDIPLFLKNQFLKKIGVKLPLHKMNELPIKDLAKKAYFIPYIVKRLEANGLIVSEYKTVPLRLLTFLGRQIPPKKMNMRFTIFFEKFTNIPLIGSFGGMCVLEARIKKINLND